MIKWSEVCGTWEKVTPGPWEKYQRVQGCLGPYSVRRQDYYPVADGLHEEDADFIVMVHVVFPTLLEVIERLEEFENVRHLLHTIMADSGIEVTREGR